MHTGESGRAPLPPPVDLRVLRLAKGQTIHVRCLAAPCHSVAEGLQGYQTHWHQGRSKICKGVGQCDPSIHKIDPIWYGFLPFEVWDEPSGFWLSIVLQITESLELDFRRRLERGQTWTISRPAVKRSGCPVRGELTGRCDLETLPEPFGVLKVLRTLFHWPDLPVPKTPNPTAPREAYTPSRGAPPPGSKAAEVVAENEERLTPEERQALWNKLRGRADGPAVGNNGKK